MHGGTAEIPRLLVCRLWERQLVYWALVQFLKPDYLGLRVLPSSSAALTLGNR